MGVKVVSRLATAISLHVDEMVEGPLGIKTARRGPAIEIAPGTVTDVPEDFWRKWLEQNKDSPLLGELGEQKAAVAAKQE